MIRMSENSNLKLLEHLEKSYEKLTSLYPEDDLFRNYLKKVKTSLNKLRNT